MSHPSFLRSFALCLAALLCGDASAQIFTDSLGASSATNWTVVQDADTSFQFGYDYSQDGLPAAPNGSDTIGLKFEVNNTAPADVNEIAAINFDETNYTGQFTFRVDVWSNWAPDNGGVGAGTTEFVGVSVGHDAFEPGVFGGSFIYTGDGDAAATDYRLYKDLEQLQAESGQYALGVEAGARDNSNPILTAAFPSIDIATAVPTQGSSGAVQAGAGGYQWMTLNVEVDTDSIGPSSETTAPGFARISMQSASSGNTVEIGTIDNSLSTEAPTIFSGAIGLLMSDLFSSVTLNPAFSFGIFDNVQVLEGLVPLPTDDTLDGDFNDDGSVDAIDYAVWREGLGGEFDTTDFGAWIDNFGATAPGVVVTPEPAAMGLFCASLLVFMGVRRRTV